MSVTASRPTCEKGGVAQGDGMAWPRVRLGDVMQRYNEIVHPGDRDAGEAVFVGLEHIEPGTGRRIGSGTVDFARMSGRKPTFRRGQIIYGYLRPYLNKVWIAEFDGCSSVDQFAFEVSRDLASVDFIASFLRSEVFLERSAIVTTTGQLPRISIEEIEAVELELPPLAVQERIAGRVTEQLAAVERGRAAARERLAAAEALPAAYYREFFGHDAPFSAAPAPPTEPTEPGWRWSFLTDLARLATGHTPSRRHPEYWNGDIPWLQLPDIRALDGRRAMDTSEYTNQPGIDNSAAVLLPANTVCMSRTASVGFVTIMGRPMATSQDFVNWVCGPDLVPEFLMHLLIACRKPIRDLGSGAVHHTIYFPTVEAFSICVPPVAEQRRIVTNLSRRLEEADKLIDRLRDELALIDALPAALLRRAFGAKHEA